MKRILKQTERTETLASIRNKKMRTSYTLSLLATLCLTVTTAATARAATYNSKMGTLPRQSSVMVAQDMGKFTWLNPDMSVNRIVVSIADQSLYAYNGQQLVAYSNISSGKPGHETPTGTFTVSEKDPDHHSNLYENAPMPFYMRLTDGGVGLHAGFIPGYPASHGCVRLPYGMARELFQHVESGTPVDIISTSVPTVAQNASTTVHLAQD